MGTRSLTRVFEDDGTEILCLYRQMDGYPTGMGAELAKFLAPLRITNGISGNSKKTANGAGCLAAQIVAHFKKDVGGFYIYAPGSKDCGEEYEYQVWVKSPDGFDTSTRVHFKALSGDEILFSGDPKDFDGASIEAAASAE